MRVRVAVLLIAFLAIVALPSEATLADQSGSVVDQVSSCLQPNGLVREDDRGATGGERCRDDVPARPPIAVLAVVFTLLAGLVPGSRARPGRRTAQRWSLPDAVAPSGAPWRAPPLPV